jgi:hypothetical protein
LACINTIYRSTFISNFGCTSSCSVLYYITSQSVKIASASKSTISTTVGPQSGQFPLWFQAAIGLGTGFVRVAAAGVPPAFSLSSEDTDDADHDVMDEYYFWIVVGDRWDVVDIAQDPDALDPTASAPSVSVSNSTSAWDNSTLVPGLRHIEKAPCLITAQLPSLFCAAFDVDSNPITGDISPHKLGVLRVPHALCWVT